VREKVRLHASHTGVLEKLFEVREGAFQVVPSSLGRGAPSPLGCVEDGGWRVETRGYRVEGSG